MRGLAASRPWVFLGALHVPGEMTDRRPAEIDGVKAGSHLVRARGAIATIPCIIRMADFFQPDLVFSSIEFDNLQILSR